MKTVIKKRFTFIMALFILITCSIMAASADELETDKKTGLATPESIYDKYVADTGFIIESDTELNDWMKTKYDTEGEKKHYLDFSEKNTVEEWNKFTVFEKFNYRVLVIDSKSTLTNRNLKNEDDFISECEWVKEYATNCCKTSTNIDAFFNALEEVERWQYRYYEKTGTFYNFLGENVSQAEEITTENLENDKEYKEIRKELEKEKELEEPDKSFGGMVKDHIFTIILFSIATVGIIIVTVIKLKKEE